MKETAQVIVIGGGVAGISAAVRLADGGARVMLLEQRKLLGGRAASFEHAIGPGGLVDNCQHVLLGCCTELQSLYARLGVSDLIQFDDAVHFADVRGGKARMRAWPLPSPFHLGPSLAGFGLLSVRARLQIARGMVSMLLAGRRGRNAREGMSFLAYLRSCGQSDETIRDYWDVIAVSALNETSADASAKYGMQVFQESFMGARGGYRLGYARSPLSDLYRQIPGVEVRTGSGVRSLIVENGHVSGAVTTAGEAIRASQTVLATSPGNAMPLIQPLSAADPQFERMSKLQFRSILGAHLLYDRPIPLDHPVSILGTRLHWVFPDAHRGELLHGVVSAADQLPEDEDLPALFDREIRSALGDLGGAKLVDSLIVKEKRATFRPLPGVDAIRPTRRTQVPGLTLAGDYTQTDWPATMEGAAISGRLAAQVGLQAMKEEGRSL